MLRLTRVRIPAESFFLLFSFAGIQEEEGGQLDTGSGESKNITFNKIPFLPGLTCTMATGNWRLIDVDALDPENAFSPELLAPQFTSTAVPMEAAS
jgi:hypothetical protein